MRLAMPSPAKRTTSAGSLVRPSLNSLRIPSFSADDAATPKAGLKTEGESSEEIKPSSNDLFDNAMKALNMAASLIKKDRFDARRLGMESLVLLTDPLRAGMDTAKIASYVVLLGSAHGEMVYSENDVDALCDASSGLGIRETILEMIMTSDIADTTSDDADGFKGIEKEFTDSLTNLCLTVLSNALHAVEESVASSLPSTQLATESRALASSDHAVSKRFIDDTNSLFGCDVLSSLLKILGQAKAIPHDACHSARCLGFLFKGCGNSHKARARRDLDAKRIISAALEVGSRSHAKLADASRQAMETLTAVDDESKEEDDDQDQIERTEIVTPRPPDLGGQQHEDGSEYSQAN
ncbi:hypothetical protein ACHAW5_001113 [Stephanodiscus triporus]|uniref:Wings apart-like protein C-terminal domain-containing protein n=1 Tax=Stephanodiscus triporus TaxID=2934178 RepID=A0ABD3P3M2_9STRA